MPMEYSTQASTWNGVVAMNESYKTINRRRCREDERARRVNRGEEEMEAAHYLESGQNRWEQSFRPRWYRRHPGKGASRATFPTWAPCQPGLPRDQQLPRVLRQSGARTSCDMLPRFDKPRPSICLQTVHIRSTMSSPGGSDKTAIITVLVGDAML